MDRNRGNHDRMSRFGPRDNYNGPPNPMQMPMQYPTRQMQMQQNPIQPLTSEQLAFELEFKKWEQSFTDWQKAYANHHDRVAYKQYEGKFLEVRDKLLIKRRQIYSKNTMETQLASELGAAAAMADSILQKFGEPSMPSGPNFDNRRGGGDSRFDKRFDRPPPIPMMTPPMPMMTPQMPMMMNRYDDSRGNRQNQNRSRSPYFNRDPPGRQDRMSRQNFSRSPPRHQGSRERNQNDMQRRGGRPSFGDNRRDERNNRDDRNRRDGNSRGRQDDNSRMIPGPKPKEAQIKRDLERKDVYPNVPWLVVASEGKPPLVGKRKKKKRAKIVKLLERKEKIANGEIPADAG
jgi:hypothetical protein